MTYRACLLVGLAITVTLWTTRAEDMVASRITGAALTRGGALAFLETLTDTVGGRVTGSAQSRAASELILATLKEPWLFGDNHESEVTRTAARQDFAIPIVCVVIGTVPVLYLDLGF